MKINALIHIDINDRNNKRTKIDDTSKVKADDYCYRAKLIHLVYTVFTGSWETLRRDERPK